MGLLTNVTLKSGRVIQLRDSNGGDTDAVNEILGTSSIDNQFAFTSAFISVLSAILIKTFTKPEEGNDLSRQHGVPGKISNYLGVAAFWSEFSIAEKNEICTYVSELISGATPTSEKEVQDVVEEVKKSGK